MRPSDKAMADSRSVQSLTIVKKKQLVLKDRLLCLRGKKALTFSLNSSRDDPKIFILLDRHRNRGLLRCFDIVFQRPYRYFSIALKVIFSLSDRHKIVTND